jgi:hypothetical protein
LVATLLAVTGTAGEVKEHVMRDRFPIRAIVLLLLVLAGAAAIGVASYNAGVQHGFVEASRTAALPPEGTRPVYVWAGPWHPGYFPVFPFFFGFLIVVLVLRGLWWRGSWRRGDWGPGRHDGVPPAFDEWHRRAHERMAGTPPPPERTA